MSLPLLASQTNKPLFWAAPQSCTSKDCKAAQHIASLSRSLMEACNSHSYAQLRTLGDQHVSPNFRARFEDCTISSWNEFLKAQRHWCELHPEWENRVEHVSAEVNENHANGTVYVLMEILRWGGEEHLKRTAVTVHKWKKNAGRWLCYESTTMRGLDPMLAGKEGEGMEQVEER